MQVPTKPWLWSRSFRFRLMVTAVVCILVPAFITLAIYNMLTKDAVKEEAVAQSRQKLQLVDGYVTNLFDYMLYIANSVQNDSSLSVVLKEIANGKTYDGPNGEYERFLDQAKILSKIDFLTIQGDSAYVTILLKNGTKFTNYPISDFDPIALKDEPWFGQLDGLTGMQSLWIGTSPTVFPIERVNSPYQISMGRTLRAGVKPYGYVFVTIMEKQVGGIFGRLSEGQETMLLDGGGRIMSHLDKEKIGESFSHSANLESSVRPEIVNVGDESYILTSQKQKLTGWELVSLTPYKQAVFKLNSIFNRVAVLQLLSFVVFVLLFLYLLGTFTRPLVRLGKMAETVQRGNLEVRSNIRGSDEIGYLGQSFDLMLDRVKGMIAEITLTQSRKRKAELAMLQAQINPHFLFNVLNSIRMKVMKSGDLDSAEMISSLSKLLRMTIIQSKDTIPLHEELSTIADYVLLMNMRQKEKAELRLDPAPDTLMCLVPRFFLQPIIENALIHGLSQRAGTIEIASSTTSQDVVISVRDSGSGMEEVKLAHLRSKLEPGADLTEANGDSSGRLSGFGLYNVCERMRMTYGESFRIEVDSAEDAGTTITMIIPKQRAEVDQDV
ncbi:histidine kinase [Paenibacillus sp. LHD-117]|uniref:cache domain-containing sensor histidine kinase n=1 Tax=Paenibacillus sp. LHD-117 TaxID=3071412 RepID=UPI0027E048BF|nr:histidine kinase [Paenibacillus sp. LHD-117]MDQ6422786.1 histidine kinase [Paenibacillus sp. LHD-117]